MACSLIRLTTRIITIKMDVIKTYEIKKYIVYRAPAGTEDWEFDHAGAVPIFNRLKLYPIRVN